MNLSSVFCSIQSALTFTGWQSVVEDDYPDFKQISCKKPSGPLGVFTRLDVLVMTPERNPAEAAGICICFLFYADPTKVTDMFRLDRIIRQDESQLFLSQCDPILNAAKIIPGNPTIKISVRPKQHKIKFSAENIVQPAFMVELGYWVSREEFPSDRIDDIDVVHFIDVQEEQIIDDRIEAIYALQGSDRTETEDLLLTAVSDPSPQVRIAGLTVLSEYCDNNYLSLFENALNDGNESVRRYAGEYLRTYRKHIRSGPVIKTRLSISDCLKALATTKDRERAIGDLRGITDPQIIEPLLTIMNCDDSFYCRTSAMDVIAGFDNPELLDKYYSLLSDKQVGRSAAYQLDMKPDPKAHELLRKAFFSDDRIAQLSASEYVRCCDNKVLQAFCHMLEDSDLEYRKVAIDRIYSHFTWRGEEQEWSENFDISDESFSLLVATLKTAANDKNMDIRGKAIESLCLIDKTQGSPILMDALEGFIRISLENNYQSKKDPWDYDWFQSSLHHAISILGDKSFCDPLIRLFKSKNWDVKIEAAHTLLNLGDTRAIGLLEEALNHEDWNVWANAAIILFSSGDNEMWNALAKALSEDVDGSTYSKQDIIVMLAKSGDARTVDVLCDILNNPDKCCNDEMVIGKIITCLGELGDPRAIESIKRWQYRELVNCDDDVVEKALSLLKG